MTEQVKYLKCVYNKPDDNMFTVGTVYEAKPSEVFSGQIMVVNDKGTVCQVPLKGILWGFEIVEEDKPEKPMNTNKLTPRSLGCFQQVADVIGEEAAEVELHRVIDCPKDLIVDDAGESLIEAFLWDDTPQGSSFWGAIDYGLIPEGYTPPKYKECSQERPEEPKKSSDEPKFGDVLHINGEPFVFIKSSSDHYYTTINQEGIVRECDAEVFDEYAPDPTQELRERILERWKGQCLYHAYDTTMSRVDVSVGDIVEFVIGNLNAEFDGE